MKPCSSRSGEDGDRAAYPRSVSPAFTYKYSISLLNWASQHILAVSMQVPLAAVWQSEPTVPLPRTTNLLQEVVVAAQPSASTPLPLLQLREACQWKGHCSLSLFLPPGQENNLGVQAFSWGHFPAAGACCGAQDRTVFTHVLDKAWEKKQDGIGALP